MTADTRTARADARNSARGGGTRAAALAISPTVKPVVLATFCDRLKAAHAIALADKFSPVVDATPPTYRRIIREARKTRRPGAWAEIKRAVAEAYHRAPQWVRDACEGLAGGVCMVAPIAVVWLWLNGGR